MRHPSRRQDTIVSSQTNRRGGRQVVYILVVQMMVHVRKISDKRSSRALLTQLKSSFDCVKVVNAHQIRRTDQIADLLDYVT